MVDSSFFGLEILRSVVQVSQMAFAVAVVAFVTAVLAREI